jgi:DUF3024 family protein
MESAVLRKPEMRLSAHPNDLDKRRIERALKSRKRYRYVSPKVLAVAGGYKVESPCCSRNIDPDGGIVDVALLLYEADTGAWQLFQKDHANAIWVFHSTHDRLIDLLDHLNADAERKFWQ